MGAENADIVSLYVDQKLSIYSIAKLKGVSSTTIRRYLKSSGVICRKASETRTSGLNASFFNEWSDSMAWVLGLCYTDGCFINNQIRLALIDLETIEKVRSLVGPYLKIYKRNQFNNTALFIHTLSFGNEKMSEDLVRLGLTSRKSLTIQFPEIPGNYVRHFIRGCWDGDGGFTKSNGVVIAQFTSGSKSFVSGIVSQLFKIGINKERLIGVPIFGTDPNAMRTRLSDFHEMRDRYGDGPYPLTVHKRRDANAYDIRIKGDRNIRMFYGYLYKDVDASILMKRKHDILHEYISCINK